MYVQYVLKLVASTECTCSNSTDTYMSLPAWCHYEWNFPLPCMTRVSCWLWQPCMSACWCISYDAELNDYGFNQHNLHKIRSICCWQLLGLMHNYWHQLLAIKSNSGGSNYLWEVCLHVERRAVGVGVAGFDGAVHAALTGVVVVDERLVDGNSMNYAVIDDDAVCAVFF